MKRLLKISPLTVVLAAVLIAGIALAATPALRVNGVQMAGQSSSPLAASTNGEYFDNSNALNWVSQGTTLGQLSTSYLLPGADGTVSLGSSTALGDASNLRFKNLSVTGFVLSSGDIVTSGVFRGATSTAKFGTASTSIIQIGAGGGATSAVINIGQGTVTQATSITTGVTVNASSMVITTVSTTLAAAANATFTVTNSTVASTSIPVCSVGSYSGTLGTNGFPDVMTGTVSAGSFQVIVVNQDRTNALNGTIKINCVVL